MNATRAYARATQETASKERLMVLLFETALRHMRNGAALLEQQQPTEALKLLTKAADIVTELSATLDAKRAPELADTLGELYRFVAERLAHAGVFREAKAAHEAARAFAPVVEGFQQAVASLGQATP
jgi:flagellar secretion chaperone FliS